MSPVVFTPLRRVPTPKGEVRHGLRVSEPSFAGFGEAYFTEVLPGRTKGWKRHTRMVMNLVVVTGTVAFILHDGADTGCAKYVLSAEDAGEYGRLTVPPGWWMAFHGAGPNHNLLMNLASSEHDPAEAEARPLEAFAAVLAQAGIAGD